jgi:RNA polymerase sigma factor (sigma-70 family)
MLYSSLTDEQLVKLYIDADEKAFEVLLQRHKQKVYTAIYLFVRDRYLAEDLFQETFIKVVDRLQAGVYREEGKFLPWVMRIANNLCIDYYRKKMRMPGITTSDGFDIFEVLKFSEKNAEQQMIENENSNKVRKLIDELPAEQKEVLILRHYANLSFKEISTITNVSINTSLGRMRYALINLRKLAKQKQEVF